LKAKRDFALAATHALACFHKRTTRPDAGEVESLDIAAEMAVETASDVSLLHAACVLLHCQLPQV
jgi:ATP-dependent protease HslVU (ClpYQ) peptidase subunit